MRPFDYIRLSETFFDATEMIAIKINEAKQDYSKYDEWFFADIYLYRQAIELLCKGLLIKYTSDEEVAEILNKNNHNITGIFNEYYNRINDHILNNEEYKWLITYLNDLDGIDKDSSLFRYPIKDGCLNEYSDSFLDIVDMINSIDQCYILVHKCINNGYIPYIRPNEIDLSLKPQFLFFANNGLANCMLYTFPFCDGYYRVIDGYFETACFLTNNLNKNHWSFLVIAYLLRHAIELSFKSMLHSKTTIHPENPDIKGHCLRQLWFEVKGMVVHYGCLNERDKKTVEHFDKCIDSLNQLDKNGLKFRYPTDCKLKYYFTKEKLDYYYVIKWLAGIYKFNSGCLSMMDSIYEYECEIDAEIRTNLM